MAENLKGKTVKGVGWSAIDTFGGQGIGFIVNLILARLLGPEAYGIIGICGIFITIFSTLIDNGFSTSLIRKKDVGNEEYNTMFLTNMAVSLFFYLVLFLCAPSISSFFNNETLVPILRVMGVLLLLQALSIVQNTIITKRIDFKTRAISSLIASIIGGSAAICGAYAGLGVWALVIYQLSKQFVFNICLWILNKWWPSLHFSKDSFKYMWGFGWKMTLSSLLDTTWSQLYQATVGKFYSPATLGQYSRAQDFANIFSASIPGIITKVSFPVIADVQDDLPRMMSVYRKIIKTTMFVTAICMLSMAAISEPLIYVLIGEQWHEASTYLPLICISFSFGPLSAINLNMLKVQGRSDIFLYLEIIKKVIAVAPILLGVFINIYWMLIGSIVIGIISYFMNSYYTGRKLKYTAWMQIKDVAPSYGIGFIIAISVFFIKYIPIPYIWILILQLVIGSFVFIVVCEWTHLEEYSELKSIIMPYLKKIYKKKESC